MTIEEIIAAGIEARNKCYYNNPPYTYISGTAYIEWLFSSTRFLKTMYPDDFQVQKYEEIAGRANGNDPALFDKLIAILKAINDYPPQIKSEDIETFLELVFENFHRCAHVLLNRHDARGTLEITDEYDVQDLVHGILRLFVNDVRPEECNPSYAGANSRTDFYLPEHEIFVEVKMTRSSLKDKEVGEQLIIDAARYKSRCKTLICFVYDKGGYLKNPFGLKNDLEKLSSDGLSVRVYISPL